MTHPTYAKILAVGLLIASLFAPLIWAPRLSAAKAVAPGHKSQKGVNAPVAQDTQTPEEPLDVVLAAPYWSTADGFVSTIEMKNYHVSNPLTVTPVLHLEQGGDVALDPVALKPSETRRININQALAKRGLYAKVGAAEIRHAPEGAFGANLTVLNEPKSLIYNFQFRIPDTTRRLEGLWWFYDEHTDGFVAAQNAGDAEMTVTPTLYARGRPYRLDPVKLRPHEMTVLRLRGQLRKLGLENETAGGVSLESSLTGVMVAGGGLVNPDIGFSAPLRMDDPDMLSMNVKHLGQTLHAIGVTIGADPKGVMGLPPDSVMNPIMNLRNVTDEPIIARPVFKYDIDGAPQSFALPEVRLNPQQVKRVDLLPYWESGEIFEQTNWGSLEINYTGRPDALIASVTSVDQTGTYVFDARIDNRLAAGFQGEYWSIEGDNDTAVTVKNITDKPATCQLSLQYGRGRGNFVMQPVTLRPGEARMIMLREVQHERVTGTDGKSLPVEATFGGLKLTEGPGGRHFLIDAVVFNPKTATCGVCGYGCLYPRSLGFTASSYIIPLTFSGDYLLVKAIMCDGTQQTGWECTCDFSSDDTTIATVDPACQSHGTGMGIGGTNFRGTAVDVPGPHCGDQTLYASCPVTVRPSVDILLNGTVLGSQTVNVIVGQKINLTTSTHPSNATVTNSQWTIPPNTADAPIASYTIVDGTGGAYSATTAQPTLTGTSVNYYWVGTGTYTVTYSATVNNTAVSKQVSFQVVKPSLTISTSSGTIAVDSIYGDPRLRFGYSDGTPGVRFSYSNVTMPTGFSGGSFQWTQVVSSANITITPNVGNQQVLQGTNMIDSGFAYPFVYNTGVQMEDSPDAPLDSSWSHLSYTASFVSYVMFKPSGTDAIWVPLKKVSWSWTAGATRTGSPNTWTLDAGSSKTVNAAADATAEPQWSARVQDVIQ